MTDTCTNFRLRVMAGATTTKYNIWSIYMYIVAVESRINLPLSMWTRTEIGLALDGAHVYIPESLWMAFCTSRRLVVRRPFSVTSEIPPRGESKFITYSKKINRNQYICKKPPLKFILKIYQAKIWKPPKKFSAKKTTNKHVCVFCVRFW